MSFDSLKVSSFLKRAAVVAVDLAAVFAAGARSGLETASPVECATQLGMRHSCRL